MEGFKIINTVSNYLKNRIITKVGLAILLIFCSSLLMGDWSGSSSSTYTMGNVGIGTNSPQANLHVYGSSKFDYNNMYLGNIWVMLGSGQAFRDNGSGGAHFYNSSGSPVHSLNLVNGNSYLAMGTGNVGIGTATPLAKLHVNGTSMFEESMYLGNMWVFLGSGHSFRENGCGGAHFCNSSGTRVHSLNLVNGNSYFAIDNGNVGIGTTSPQTKLDVAGTVTAQSYACSSDARYKKDINPITNALSKIMSLTGVSYFWDTEKFGKKNFAGEKQIGFLAQDVEKVLPELVLTGKDGYKSMSYDKMSAVLVEALKELKTTSDEKITRLERENALLKNRIASLEKLNDRIAKLERELGIKNITLK